MKHRVFITKDDSWTNDSYDLLLLMNQKYTVWLLPVKSESWANDSFEPTNKSYETIIFSGNKKYSVTCSPILMQITLTV